MTIDDVLDELNELRSADEITYSAYSRLFDIISDLDQQPRVMTLEEIKDGKDAIIYTAKHPVHECDGCERDCTMCGIRFETEEW